MSSVELLPQQLSRPLGATGEVGVDDVEYGSHMCRSAMTVDI